MRVFAFGCGRGERPSLVELVSGFDEELFEFVVRVGVGGEAEVSVGVGDAEGAEGHAAAEFFGGLFEGEGFA